MKTCQYCGIDLKGDVSRGAQCVVCKNGRARYRLDRNQQIALMESQDGKCSICSSDIELFTGSKGAQIDHNHKTGEVRGILCIGCNTMLGKIEHHGDRQWQVLEKVVEYLNM
jgi:hypothetical protein